MELDGAYLVPEQLQSSERVIERRFGACDHEMEYVELNSRYNDIGKQSVDTVLDKPMLRICEGTVS